MSRPTDRPTKTDRPATDHATLADRLTTRLILAAPLVVAGWFQAHAIHDLLQTNWVIAVGFTLCWEGAAYYVATLYCRALLRGDSTLSHRLGMLTYAVGSCGLLAAELHMQNKRLWLAGAVGVLTLSSIYLWSRDARDRYRDQLHARGLVDAQSVKFSALRWLLCPVETPKAFRFGIKFSLSRLGPDAVLAEHRAWQSAGRPAMWPPTDRPQSAPTVEPTKTDRPAKTTVPTRPQSEPTKLPTPRPTETRPATPDRPQPTTPTRSVRAADRPTDESVISRLHELYSDHPDYPTKKPTQADIQSVAGGSPDRAIRLRKAFLADHASRTTTDQEEAA